MIGINFLPNYCDELVTYISTKFTSKIQYFSFWHFLGDSVVLWKKGERVLTAGPIHVRKDFRLNLVEANSLKIENVHVSDTGNNCLIYLVYVKRFLIC